MGSVKHALASAEIEVFSCATSAGLEVITSGADNELKLALSLR
jgi:hypothetical protein